MSAAGHAPGPGDDYVPVIFAEDYSEAEFYKALLEDHGLEVRIGDGSETSVAPTEEEEGDLDTVTGQGVPVLVPSESLSEAEDIIDRHHEAEDEYDDDEFDDDDDDDEFDDFEEFDPDEAG